MKYLLLVAATWMALPAWCLATSKNDSIAMSRVRPMDDGYQFDCTISLHKGDSDYSARFYGDATTGDGTFLIKQDFELLGNQLTFTFHEGAPSIHQFEAQLWQRVGDQYFDTAGVLEKSGQALSLVSHFPGASQLLISCSRR